MSKRQRDQKVIDDVPTTLFGNPRRLPWNIDYNIKRHMEKTGCSASTGSYSSFTGRAHCDSCGMKLPR